MRHHRHGHAPAALPVYPTLLFLFGLLYGLVLSIHTVLETTDTLAKAVHQFWYLLASEQQQYHQGYDYYLLKSYSKHLLKGLRYYSLSPPCILTMYPA